MKDEPRKKGPLTAYISESRDREGNTFHIAAICDEGKKEIVEELSSYDRGNLEKEVLRHYPEIEIENA